MPFPPSLSALVQRFQDHRDSYTAPGYNETQLREEFLNPFFDALGWDVYNRQGYAEAYKEVIHEDAVKVGTATKAPDYSFRIGGVRKFFVEAKKPSVSIKDDQSPAFQLRRYAWSAKLPLSILSNFAEFAVYDCRRKPDKNDKAGVGRILYITCDEYEKRWDEIASLFTREAIQKGSFDKFATGAKRGKGTAEVDDAFLADIEEWRFALAKNIAIRNPKLSMRELNFAVQRTIDRLIFLRICEDRGIEDYGRLQAHLNGERIYERLCTVFREADDRYNSGLFHFREEKDRGEAPDTVTLALSIDDRVLREIISGLYYPESPYEFSVLPADILGQVYEQFLGKVIRLTAGHQAKVEDKPEVRKAGGVFYTPTYIVEYIVKNTVGKLLASPLPLRVFPSPPVERGPRGEADPPAEIDLSRALPDPSPVGEGNPFPDRIKRGESRFGRPTGGKRSAPLAKGGQGGISPKEAAGLRILDPACGSGSFLIGAYQYLLDWHRDWYLKNDPEKWTRGKNAALYKTGVGEYRLTTPERKRILLNNIYGVDIDTQAVEVTKLSLLLKVLEGETEQTIAQQLKLFHTRALPDLGNNIKCGNSLIGSDFYEGVQESLALYEDEEEKYRINAFDWDGKDGFPEIMRKGGFDAVIGNPPYVRQEILGDKFKQYAAREYKTYSGTADLYVYFFERAHQVLKQGGLFGMICSNKFMRANYGKALRDYLARETQLVKIVDFGELPVFQNAATFPAVFLTCNEKIKNQKFIYAAIKRLDFKTLDEEENAVGSMLDNRALYGDNWTLASGSEINVIEKMKIAGVPLGEYVKGKIFRGVLTGLNEAFVIDEATRKRLIEEDPKSKEVIKPFIFGRDIRRFCTDAENQHLILIPKGWTNTKRLVKQKPFECFHQYFPAVAEYLRPFESKAEKRFDRGDYWWELRSCDYYGEFEKPKIIYSEISRRGKFTLDNNGMYLDTTAYICGNDSKYLLGILNSKAILLYIKRNSSVLGDADKGGRLRWKRQYMESLPIRPIDFTSSSDKILHNKLVSLVSSILDLNKKLSTARDDQDKTLIARRIDDADRRIDALVYELYGLTGEEIRIVEGGK